MASFRKFRVIGFEGKSEVLHHFTAKDLFCEDQETELMFSMQMETDSILDLKVGQSKFINISRDNSEHKGVIIREQ